MKGIKIGRRHFFVSFYRLYSDKYCKKQYEGTTGKDYKAEPERCDFFLGIKTGYFRLGLKLNYKQGEGYDGLYLYFGFWRAVFVTFVEKGSMDI